MASLSSEIAKLSKEQLYELYQQFSIDTIALKFNVSRTCVLRWIDKHGIERRTQKQAATFRNYRKWPSKQELINFIENNHGTVGGICKHFGAARESVLKWLSEYDIPLPLREEQLSKRYKIQTPSVEILQPMYKTMTTKDIGKHFGVSDVLVSSWLREVGIEAVQRTSVSEQQILDFCNSYGFNFQPNKNFLGNKKYLDGLDLEKKIAVEYCGLYWHNELQPRITRSYHKDKFDICAQKNVQLITIFEDEWIDRRQQVQHYLLGTLGIFQQRVYARNCYVNQIDLPTARSFIEKYHIQPPGKNSTAAWGLFYNKELLGVAIIGRHHRKQTTQHVLTRIAFKHGIQVIGGFSKIISKLPRPLLTWSDNRWSLGNSYKKCGFVLDKELPPDYFYTKGTIRKNKQSFQKIKKQPGQSEKQAALEMGWARIWDCGKRRWKLE